MAKIIRRLMLLILVQHLMGKANAQELFLQHFTVDQGLPSNEVYRVLEDTSGYLWLTTDRGIVRYNGYMFEVMAVEGAPAVYPWFGIYRDQGNGKIYFIGLRGQVAVYEHDRLSAYLYNDRLASLYAHHNSEVSMFAVRNDSLWIYYYGAANYIITPEGHVVEQNESPGVYFDPKARKFIDVTPQSGLYDIPGDTGFHANCFTMADFNNDGNVDLVTGNFYYNLTTYLYPNDRCQVFLGDGTGKFTWKPDNGLSSIGLHNVRMLTALDYDRDGNLDLFVATFYESISTGVRDHGYLLKGNGDGTFTDVTSASGLAALPEAMYGSSSTDWNDDCRPDIFTAPYCRSAGMVLKNEGDGTFTDMASALGYNLELTGAGQRSCTFSITPEDVNNDGYMDMFFAVVHGGNAPGQFRSTIGYNRGPAYNYSFDIREDVLPVNAPATQSRGDYEGVFIDFDNDGLKDLVMAQGTYFPATDRTYFWKQQADHTFIDATFALGLTVPLLKSTSAVEAIDYDMDGDDDLLVSGPTTGALQLWQNTVGQDHNYVSVKLATHAGNGINGSAIGARIYVYYEGKMQMREVMAGRGMHTGQQPFILNFGLGDAASIDSIIVRWPDNNCSRTTVYKPAVNRMAVVNSFPAGVEEISPSGADMKVFPNPVSQYLVVQDAELVKRTKSVYVSDITGRAVNVPYSTSDGNKLIFDMGKLAEGEYLIRIELEAQETFVHKVIKR